MCLGRLELGEAGAGTRADQPARGDRRVGAVLLAVAFAEQPAVDALVRDRVSEIGDDEPASPPAARTPMIRIESPATITSTNPVPMKIIVCPRSGWPISNTPMIPVSTKDSGTTGSVWSCRRSRENPRQRHREEGFQKLRRLEAEDAAADPALRAVHRGADPAAPGTAGRGR